MLRHALALAAGLWLAAPAVHAETWYAQRVTTGDAGLNIEHLWSKGGALRAEVVVGTRPVVTLVNATHYVVVDTLAGKGLSVERHANARARDAAGKRPFGDELDILVAQGGEFVRVEELGAASCRLHRLTDDRGRQEVCVDPERELPVFLRRWDRASNREATIQYVNWSKGFEIGGQFFQPDPRVTLERHSYAQYVKALDEGKAAYPVFYPQLLHGPREKP